MNTVTCKGSINLGTGCGSCIRCKEQIETLRTERHRLSCENNSLKIRSLDLERRLNAALDDCETMRVYAVDLQRKMHPVAVAEHVTPPKPLQAREDAYNIGDVISVKSPTALCDLGAVRTVERTEGAMLLLTEALPSGIRLISASRVVPGARTVDIPRTHPVPCDPPTEATHDTPAGKQAAESVIRDDWKTEPADEIKVGDLVEVVSNRGRNTWLADVGSLGIVTSVEDINDSISVHLDDVPGKKNALAGYVSFCDVRKVTT